jgi:aminopeptidase N
MRTYLAFVVVALAACGGSDPSPDAPGPIQPTANPDREVIDTQLQVDLASMTATATITLGASDSPGASLEVGDLMIDNIMAGLQPSPALFAVDTTTKIMTIGIPATPGDFTIVVTYHWKGHEMFDGVSAKGFTFLWPYFCGDVFPCHSAPSDGTTFSLDLQGVPAGKTAVYPKMIATEAPSYQVAWAVDDYTKVDVGTTTAGTKISTWYRNASPNGSTQATNGTKNLVAAFDWFEKTLGPYRFGNDFGTVAINWGPGAYGGMEHHPYVHISQLDYASEEVHVHEAAHGWFGDGIRIKCWEDFVLSEGTVSYLAARALDVVAPQVGQQTWQSYAQGLAQVPGSDPVWPQSCGQVDVLNDNLFTNAPYMRGAFFYKAVADKVGATMVDAALHKFFMDHQGKTGTMQEMLDTLTSVTGYDVTACAKIWLKDPTTPTPAACP